MNRANIMVGMATLLFLIIVLPTAAASDVSRAIPSGAQQAGTDISITLTVTIDDGATYYGIDEFIPAGLTVTDTGGGDTTEAGHLKWVESSGAVSTTYTYKVSGPIGSYAFGGIYQTELTSSDQVISGNTNLVIGESIGEDISRSIPSGTQNENVDIPITLTVTIDDSTYYGIDETIPAGLTVTDTGGGDTTEAGHLKWVESSGASSTSYTYKVQGTAGSYAFSGIYQTEGTASDQTISGNSNLAIGEPSGKNVCRTIPSTEQNPNEDISIKLTVTVDGATYYGIDEIIPPGLIVTDTGGGDTSEAGHLKWVESSGAIDTVYTYKVKGPVGAYTFDGIFQIEGMSVETTIDCNTNLVIDENPCLCDFCLELEPGWNMVSIPKTIDSSQSNMADDVFKIGEGEVCLCYDETISTEDPWIYDDGIIEVVPCKGYLVYKQSANTDYSVCVDFTAQGQSVPPELQLYNGWNLIGHPDVTSTTVGNFASFTGLSDTMTQLWHRSNDGTWTGYPLWGLTSVTPGKGYWAFLDADDVMAGTP